ncbi:MAG TPA: VOC family protein [Polyangia bacterium]|nr:VOC family protein [Polyangia bacterium]
MFHHLAIQVRDLPLVERFYREVLGLRVLKRWPSTDIGDGASVDRSVWLASGDDPTDDSFVALERVGAGEPTAAEDPARATRPGLHLIALRIGRGARATWERRLADAGAVVEARTSFTLYVRDPEGNRVGLSHWPEPAEA